ncbi:sigma-54-dependent transcriptional regulator [Nitrospirota bacterium]
MKQNRILVVDDEVDICRALEFLLIREGYEVETAENGEKALLKLKKKAFDLVISDLRMGGIDGIELLRKINEDAPATVFILMTAFASVENAVEAMKLGAADYIVKPFVNDEVILTVKRFLKQSALEKENSALRRQLSDRIASTKFIGDSPRVREMFRMLEKIIPTKSNVLLLGESGSGKGIVAEIIHYNSPRRDKPFLSINCSAIPETLLESELFGYKKGAFTGASTDKPGLVVAADGGTLFLDEIGDMPISVQSKLLKVVEEGEVLPLGDIKTTVVDVRFIAATNQKLEQAVKNGTFREDLYYRLDVIELMIPPLRERREDIAPLIQFFLEKFSREYDKRIKSVSDSAMQRLIHYDWPGNVRELGNVIARAAVLCSSDCIEFDDIPSKVDGESDDISGNLKESLHYYERKLIYERLSACEWNKEETALDLDIDLATLYRKMKKLNIITRKGD